MWSGPRNLSTAMMYAFAARADCAVWDEPFYAAYLAATGIDHPMRDEVIAAGETDPQAVAARCLGSIPAGKPHFYQKHMTHHMVEGFPLDWMAGVTNVFLIRHPARVLASYVKKRETPTLEDIGIVQQVAIYDRVRAMGQEPVVIDSADIRADPEGMLTRLCEAIGLPFDPAMLSWPSGGHPDDGVWAAHWYDAVHQSTGFGGPESADLPDLDGPAATLLERVLPCFDELRAKAI